MKLPGSGRPGGCGVRQPSGPELEARARGTGLRRTGVTGRCVHCLASIPRRMYQPAVWAFGGGWRAAPMLVQRLIIPASPIRVEGALSPKQGPATHRRRFGAPWTSAGRGGAGPQPLPCQYSMTYTSYGGSHGWQPTMARGPSLTLWPVGYDRAVLLTTGQEAPSQGSAG